MKSKTILTFISVLLLLLLLTGCGEDQSKAIEESRKEASVTAETTVVLETTGDGDTIEQDSEGNKITKDEKGTILSVEDKDGKPVDVEEYITTHTWGLNDDSSGSSGSAEKSDGSGGENSSGHPNGSGISGDPGGKSSPGKGSGASSDSSSSNRDDTGEDSIPVVIATLPDDKDLEKIPDL